MERLNTSDWLVLNTIIYKIYTTIDLTDMRQNFLEQMKQVISFDAADFYLAKTDSKEGLIMPVFLNCKENHCDRLDNEDYSRGIMYSGRSMVYRETDIILDEERVKTTYYKEVYEKNYWHYSLQMVLASERQFLGVVTFYRNMGKEDFSYDDIFVVDMLKEHLAYRLFQSKKERELGINKISVTQAVKLYGLTNREEMVVRELMAGRNNQEICEKLVITVNTNKKHILNIYRKLGINNRIQLMKMIRERE